MSEEVIKLPLALQTTEPDDVSVKSNSTGKSGKAKKSVVPHYLRASTGSCHDLCKYGRRQVVEEKPWRSMRKRIAAKPPPHIDGQSLAESDVVLSRRKKSPVVKLKPSSESSSHVSDFHETIKHEVIPTSHGSRRNSLGTEFVDDQISVDSEALSGKRKAVKTSLSPSSDCQSHISESVDVVEQELFTKSSGSQNPIEDEVLDSVNREFLSGDDNLETTAFKPPCDSKTLGSSSVDIVKREESDNARRSRDSKDPKLLSGRKEKTVARHRPTYSKSRFSDASEITKQVLPSSGKLKVSSNEASLKTSARNVSLKIKPVAVKASASPDPLGISNSKRNIELKMSNKEGGSKAAAKKVHNSPASSSKAAIGKVLASPRASFSKVKASPTVFVAPRPILRKHRSQKVGSSLKNHNNKSAELDQRVDEVAEKTLYVIKVDPQIKYLDTKGNRAHAKLHASRSSMDKPQSLRTREGINKKEPKRMPRKAATDGSQGKDSKSVKLNFQRGKVVDIRSEIDSPRRLKYRRGRTAGETQIGKVISQRRSFKQHGPVECYNSRSQNGSEKVVLRHQDTVRKKDAQGLLNNLIEETASKLVETRKSKVKALVGAFESVISSKKPTQ